ncbi:hypothetical protein GCM10023340_16650 [Nocardioides marinquilinus]|uniref:AI-2E family transporter n=1 Tax=Nocardioides marinquilinus TaxID=1210400 RepID=A0ABP9PGC0_9ACTN
MTPPEKARTAEPDNLDETEGEPESPESPVPPADAASAPERRRRLRRRSAVEDDDVAREREREERVLARIAAQWAQMRDERRSELDALAPRSTAVPAAAGARGTSIPWGLDVAASWGWRLLVIAAAGYVLLWLVGFFAVITIPIAIALLLSALATPFVHGLRRLGLPRGFAALIVVIGLLGLVGLMLTFAGQQVASGAQDLADSTVKGLGEIKLWLKEGPLHASESQIDGYIEQAQAAITERTADSDWLSQATEIGGIFGHVLAGLFIVLFGTYFFLADGDRIWSWLVRIAPRAARERVDSSGRVAWISLTQFVRATVIVALTDAAGVMIGAAVLGVPFVLAIGVLVFLGAFVPMVGAFVAGSVAVLVALVDQGPVTALIMFAVVVGVQQFEGHVLQPFLMGRWVSVHPLGVILAIAAGILVAGIAGALVAVPLAAAVNAVVQHLAAHTEPGSDPKDELHEDYAERNDVSDTGEFEAVTPADTGTADERA